MKAINHILGFGGFAAAVVAAIYISRFAAFAWRCRDVPLTMSCTFGVIWFAALAVKIIGWAWSTPGGAGEAGRGAAK